MTENPNTTISFRPTPIELIVIERVRKSLDTPHRQATSTDALHHIMIDWIKRHEIETEPEASTHDIQPRHS